MYLYAAGIMMVFMLIYLMNWKTPVP